MPVMNIDSSDELWENASKIISYMLYPEDADARESRLLTVEAAAYLRLPDDNKEVTISQCHLKRLLSAPPISELQARDDGLIPRGAIAGRIFLFMMEMGADDNLDASLNKARFLTYHYFAQARNQVGEKVERSSGNTKFKEIWRQFRSVAHLWAGHQIGMEVFDAEKVNDINKEGLYPIFAAGFAKALIYSIKNLPEPKTLRTKHCKRIIGLTEKSWRIPDSLAVPSFNLTPSGLSDEDGALLEVYSKDWSTNPKAKK